MPSSGSGGGRPTVDLRINAGQQRELTQALDRLEAQYAALLAVWPQLPAWQRQRVLAGSPVLRRLVDLGRRLSDGD